MSRQGFGKGIYIARSKLEGNPDHPGTRCYRRFGLIGTVLDMYDPDRLQEVTFPRGSPKNWESFMAEFRAAIDENRKDGGAGIRFLTETVTSPTLIDQFTKLKAELPNAKWVQYEPVNNDNVCGAKLAFGTLKVRSTNLIRLRGYFRSTQIYSGFNVALLRILQRAVRLTRKRKRSTVFTRSRRPLA